MYALLNLNATHTKHYYETTYVSNIGLNAYCGFKFFISATHCKMIKVKNISKLLSNN